MKQAPEGQVYSRGDIVYPWSSPVPLVFVEGDSAEMGRQFAEATRSIMGRNLALNAPTIERQLGRSRIGKREYVKVIEAAVRKFTESEYLDEVQAMADAGGFRYEDLLLLNANVDLATNSPTAVPDDRFSCSAFGAWGKATPGYTAIAGHNDDGNRVMDQYSVLKVARPKHGYPFICPQVPGYLGYDCLVNANQMFVCGTAVDDKMKRSELMADGVPNWALYRWLGQYSSGSADASKRLLSAKSMTFKNWCFVSGHDGGDVVEATPRHHASMKLPGMGDWFGIATCVVSPAMSKHTVTPKGTTSGVYRKASVEKEARDRYGQIGPESAIEILSSHYDSLRKRDVASEHTPCRHMEYEGRFAGTCRSLIASFSKESTRIDVCLGNPCNGYWRSLMFDDEFRLTSGYNAEDRLERKLADLLVAM